MHDLMSSSIKTKPKKEKKIKIKDGIQIYLQTDLGTAFFCLLLETVMKNTFDSSERNILLVL